ncbi:MFS transporter [Pseudoblastomonas halimionae]|uniref:MFS transporter n=1 Tax=Alteriqipengyuania halimionae TaxID=1926630 RepID=A0A6I4TZA8_9SPHN|nr:MFS transporter [Alteriqipengyuania halimionae]MXP08968.1 MFS transporter [Alteriqipengyuania halimionae]
MATIAPSPATSSTLAPTPPMTRVHRLSFGFGAIANGVKNAAFSTYLLLFYNQVLGVPAAIVSGAIALTLLVDAFADPFIGRWSDMTRSQIGRRHPFIFGSALPTSAFFVLSWFPPDGLSDMQMGFWIFALASLTRMSISAFEIPTSAMAAELTDNYSERTGLFGLRYFFGYLGTFGFAAFSLAVFFVATPEISRGQLNPEGYVKFAWLGGALILIAILVCGFGTLSRVPNLRQRDEPGEGATPASHFKEMWEAFRNRGFLAIFGFGVFKYTAIGLYAATTVYFSTYVFKLGADELALLTFDSLIAAIIAAPLAPRFSRWLGKRNTSMFMAIIGITLGISPLFLTFIGVFFKPGDPLLLPTLFVIGAVYGAMIAISLINTSSMLADVVEDHAVRTGQHTAGVFFAASSFMQQCSAGFGIMMAGIVLELSDFPTKAEVSQITPAMEQSLIIHYIPFSLGLWVIGALFLLFYPITENTHRENVERLKAREAQAREQSIRDGAFGSPAR